jgi:hypothetical protein
MVSEPDPPTLPFVPVRDLLAWFQASQAPGIVIGALAVSLLGRPRMTRDVDAVVLLPPEQWDGFLRTGNQFGFVPRLENALAFAHQSRVLLLRHQPSDIDVDVSFGLLPFEQEMVRRSRPMDAGGILVPVPTPEDLIIMKAVAHRDRDLEDIAGILDTQSKIDLRRVRRWVRDFAATLEMPEILEDLEGLLSRRRKGRRKGKS